MKQLKQMLIVLIPLLFSLTIQPVFAWVDPIDTNDYQNFNNAIGIKNEFSSRENGTVMSYFINSALPYLLTGAGLILFAMLISGGFTMMTAVTDPKKAEVGKARITAAIIGFIIVFGAYWITQILEIVLGVKILQ